MGKTAQTIEYKRALVYCRVSSERQVNEGHGLDSQEQRCLSHAQSKGLAVVKIFRDQGISGKLFERPAMQQLIAYLDSHKSERFVIIFDDLKRFARDVEVHLRLRTELVSQRGAKLDCLNFNFEDSPAGRFVEMVIAGAAQLEREQNQIQVIQKMKARLEVGYWAFCPPPGLKFVKDGTKGQILRPNAPISAIFKLAIEKYRDFELNTLEEIQRYILSQYALQGIKKTLSLNGVKRILTNVLYAGCIIYEPWNIPLKKNVHEGFISYETYLAVQDRLSNSSKPRIRADKSEDFPLRNYIKCYVCKHELTASWFKGRKDKYAYYYCKQKNCPAKMMVKADFIDTSFITLLKNVTPNADTLKLAEAILIDLWESKKRNEGQIKAGIELQIQNLEEKNKTLVERIANSTKDALVTEYEKAIAVNAGQIENLKKELDKTKYSQDGFQTALRAVFNFISDPLEQWQTRDYEGKRLLLSMYFDKKIVCFRQLGLQTPESPFICGLFPHKALAKNHLVEMPGVKPGSGPCSSSHCSQD
jgi:site-specific DNA recombinase